MDNQLPVDLLHWSIAIAPLVLLLIMLVVFRWSGGASGWIAMAIAGLFSLFMFQASFENVAVGFGKGLWEAFSILIVIWTALLLYHVTDQSGSFKVIRHEIRNYSDNSLFLVLGFGWVFASFLQGITGFGAPVAVVAPLLVGIGVKPLKAVVIPLFGHAWGNTFGTLGVAWIAMTNVVDIENQALAAFYSGILLWVPNLLAGIAICWLFAKWKGIKEGWIAVVVISLIQGGGELAMASFYPALSAFIPSIAAVGALFLLGRMKRYSKKSDVDKYTTIFQATHVEEEEKPNISIHKAFMPYYVLAALTVVMLGITPIADFINQFEFGFPFPAVGTGYGFEMKAEEAYSAIAPLSNPAFFLLVSFVFGYFWYKHLGLIGKGKTKNIFIGLKSSTLGATLAITGFLTMAMIMENAGQTEVIAFGVAQFSPPILYVALANIVGIVGSFMTSSNTASNVLFAPLHGAVVHSSSQLSMPIVMAAQTTGGAIGNVISPGNVLLGTSTAGILGKESEVYKSVLSFALIAGVAVAIISVLIHFITG